FSPEQLRDLFRVNDEINGVLSGENPSESTTGEESRDRLTALYVRLEAVRASMRHTVVAFHADHKGMPEASYGYTEEGPLTLTVFDQIGLIGQRDKNLAVRTFVEPLFFRSAYRAMRRAQNAQVESIKHGGTAVHLEEEIEASATSITLSAMCLEAYINGF